MVADCIPLLLRSGKLVAAVHVGRAGLMNSIALKTVAQMRELGATQISGSIGPAICGSCYEVPQELHDQVSASHPLASSKTRTGTPALDLPKALIAALAVVDVAVGNLGSCTLEDDNYFSYRRNQVTGRQAGVIKL
jgi:copper oxidase (laccase) domain-containing protein